MSTSLGAAPEMSPTIKWLVTDRLMIPEIFISINRNLTGGLREYSLTNGSGVIVLEHFNYSLKLKTDTEYTLQERVDMLVALAGKRIYLCDNYHENDGELHTTRPYVLKKVGTFSPIGVMLPWYKVDIELEDARVL